MIKAKNIFLFTLLFSSIVLFNLSAAPLPVDEAFRLTAQRLNDSTIQAQWDIAEGYHLYKSEISISLDNNNGIILGQIILPKGIPEHSQVLGNYDVYKNKLTIDIPVIKWGKSNADIAFNYQGCKDSSVCYPPVTKVFSIAPPPETSFDSISTPTLSSSQQLLKSGNILLILASFFVFGIFLSLTPCVLPMIPILVGIIMGQKEIKTFKAFTLSLFYVLGVAVTYTLAGIITAMLGNSVQSILQNFWVILACSLIFVLLSLSLFGVYELQLPSSIMNKLNKASQKTKKGSYIGVFLMGAISSLIVSPCVSAPLAGALIYIASTGNIFLGGSALFFLSLGMGVLLIIAGITGGKLFLKAGMWMIAIRYFLGILMLAMAIWLVSRVISTSVTNILWSLLLIGVGYYAGAFEPHKGNSAWLRFRKFIAFLILLSGVAFAVKTAIGHISLIRPIGTASSQSSVTTSEDSLFNVVTNIDELQKFIDKAIKEKKPVFIDYYADWCTACKEMDGTTFKNPDVRHALKSFVAIRADITKNDAESVKLRAKYKVFAPPYFVFLDNKGNQLTDASIAGEVKPDELLSQMNIITSLVPDLEKNKELLDQLYQTHYESYIGNKDGKLVIFDFFDNNCSDCKDIAPTLEKLAGDNKDLKVVFIDYPILKGTSTYAALVCIQALQEGKYQTLHDAFMANVGKMKTDDEVNSIAQKVGVDISKVKDNDALKSIIISNLEMGHKLKITNVPTLFIGYASAPHNTAVIVEPKADELETLINKYLKEPHK